jgi:signal transduction histidine kinase
MGPFNILPASFADAGNRDSQPDKFLKVLISISLGFIVLAGWGFYQGFPASVLFSLNEKGVFDAHTYMLTFYGMLFLGACFLAGMVFARKQTAAITFLVSAALCFVIALYATPSVFSINLCIYCALVIAGGTVLRHPYNIIGIFISILIFWILTNKTYIISVSIITPEKIPMEASERLILFIVSGTVGVMSFYARIWAERWDYEQKITRQGQEVILQLSEFNRRLQAHAYEASEESATRERNRITREMHDANGYAFTNILALMDAAISSRGQSWVQLEEHLQMARNQAYDDLMESRQTLRTLRNKLKLPPMDLPKNIFDITGIFRECTGITIEVSYGNIKNDYGPAVNRIIGRIIQEALTNAARHGHATSVSIQLWSDSDILYLYVLDNGRGTEQIVKGIGLLGMEERVAPYGGKVETFVLASGGFKLSVTLPLNTSFESKEKLALPQGE